MIHQNPIPTASRAGNMLCTSVIGGRDADTGQVPATAEEQAANCFKLLAKVLEKGGATPGDVAHVTVFVRDDSVRAAVNGPWVAMFPDEHSRPARHTIVTGGTGNSLVQIEATAVIQD
jgi:enamine deaminase RidA (YjgF/YER057c/UK114 family)